MCHLHPSHTFWDDYTCHCWLSLMSEHHSSQRFIITFDLYGSSAILYLCNVLIYIDVYRCVYQLYTLSYTISTLVDI
jgi:uncharacterized membrane protein